ncbi:hypothetical protein V5799_019896 [Amblyomma americanum]|uniref:Uncharacterized protein n=1 Tax=Amblyomma americanum TaxID=6943 RepID=A0AAQ4EWC2_AMBAM
MLRGVMLPSKIWCRLNCNSDASVLFATTSIRRDTKLEILHEKSVLFCAYEDKVSAQMFLWGALCGDFTIDSLTAANRVLREADASTTCRGAMTSVEFRGMSHILTPKLRSAAATFGGFVFSTRCLGKVSSQVTKSLRGCSCTGLRLKRPAGTFRLLSIFLRPSMI